MFNNKDLQSIFIKVAIASFVLTVLIAAPYISRRSSSKAGANTAAGFAENADEIHAAAAPSDEGGDVFAALKVGKASDKQVKPSFGNLPNQLFPGNRPFSLDFHQMPLDYLVPQAPEVTKAAIVKIRELKIADLEAIEAQQAMARNYDKSPGENGEIK